MKIGPREETTKYRTNLLNKAAALPHFGLRFKTFFYLRND